MMAEIQNIHPISIHELRVELDCSYLMVYNRQKISIHELRVELDIVLHLRVSVRKNFNPRAPCGARLCSP